jgi:hypothetical protein
MATRGFANRDGCAPENVVVLPEHATPGSFEVGDLVKIGTNGKVQIVSSDQNIYGIALDKYTGTENTDIHVEKIDTSHTYVAQADTTTAVTNQGSDYGLNIGTAGSMSVDLGDESTTSVFVEKLDPRDETGTSGGRLQVKFLSAVLDSNTP